MSDGITEGYRASSARERFEELWEEAHSEDILLDAKSDLEVLSVEQIILYLIDSCNKLELKTYDRFPAYYGGKRYLVESVSLLSNQTPPATVRVFSAGISFDGVHRTFEKESFVEALQEAYLFSRWVVSEEGKEAIDILNDW
jgi:hypothetical protein